MPPTSSPGDTHSRTRIHSHTRNTAPARDHTAKTHHTDMRKGSSHNHTDGIRTNATGARIAGPAE